MALTIIEFVIALGILIFLHEFGHYIMARLFKIEVEEFGFGFPPRLVKLFTFQGTEFTLNWIPFGAFVRPKGENDPEVSGGLAAANPWKRLAVLLGGPVVNIVTGILLFSLLFTITGAPDTSKIEIMVVSQGSPAETSGLKVGDLVRSVNGTPITTTTQLSQLIQQNLGKEVTIIVERDGKPLEIRATPRTSPPPNQGALGIQMGNPMKSISWFQSLPPSVNMAYQQVAQLASLPGRLIQGTVNPQDARVSGPVGMFDIYSQFRERDIENQQAQPASAASGILNRLLLLATISVALGITNLLPIPALDGGRILFLLPEIILRRRIPAQYENLVHLIGFAALLILMVYITAQDIINPIQLP